jgi:hypothetical protein
MAEFVWIDWNLAKIDAHGLSAAEVEHAWANRRDIAFRDDPEPGVISYGTLPNGRAVKIVWRWNGIGDDALVFVVTAYKVPKHRTNRA